MQGCAEAGGATAVATPSCWYCRRPQVLLVVMVCSTSNCLYTLIRIPHPPSGACRSWQVKYSKRTSQLHKSATTTSCGSLVVPDLLFRTKREVARAAAGTCFYFNELDACSLQHQFGTLLRKVGDWRRARLDLPRPRYGEVCLPVSIRSC
jgi:hypothetical protein